MALSAKIVRILLPRSKNRIWRKIRNERAGPAIWKCTGRDLARIVSAFQDMAIGRSMRTTRARPTELAVVFAVVAIGAEDARSHRATRSSTGEV